ncbi:MAG: GNAT family N-acetyltransferase [Pseudonocardiaceae bacterium]
MPDQRGDQPASISLNDQGWAAPLLTDGLTILDGMTLADAPAVASACRDEETQRWLPLPNPYLLQDAIDFINGQRGSAATNQAWIFAIRPHTRDRLIGCIGVHAQSTGVVMLGYWIAPQSRRCHHAARALRLAAGFAFDTLRARRAEMLIDSQNMPSRRTALRAGAIYEGLRRNAMRAGGKDHDSDVYALVPADLSGN